LVASLGVLHPQILALEVVLFKGGSPIQKRPHNAGGKHDDMISALASLGVAATAEEIERTSKELPAGLSEPELVRQLFLAMRKQG